MAQALEAIGATASSGTLSRARPTQPCGPQQFMSRGSEAVFVVEFAENGFCFYGIELSATVS